MKIKKNTNNIFVRLVDYNKNDYLEEHLKIFSKNGYVWLLKMGKNVSPDFLNEVIKNNGGLIIKKTAKNGNDFYFCKFESNKYDESTVYPEYYNEIFNEYATSNKSSLGTWFKITEMKKLKVPDVKKFKTISTGRDLYECGTKFNQVSQMHVVLEQDLNL